MTTTLNLPLFDRVTFGFEGEIKTKQIHKPSRKIISYSYQLSETVIRKIVCNIV